MTEYVVQKKWRDSSWGQKTSVAEASPYEKTAERIGMLFWCDE